jgi:hypothetical protein
MASHEFTAKYQPFDNVRIIANPRPDRDTGLVLTVEYKQRGYKILHDNGCVLAWCEHEIEPVEVTAK